MLCFDNNRHGPTTLGSDEKSRTMWMCLVPCGHHQSSVQDEDEGSNFLHCDTLCDSEILSGDSGSTSLCKVGSYLVRIVVYNLASYGPELYAGIATPDASVNSYIETEKSQRRVNLV